MKNRTVFLALSILAVAAPLAARSQTTPAPAVPAAVPTLDFPEHYRDWIYLSTGFDMAYNPPAGMADHHMFTNIFVNPEAYQAFKSAGTWPEGTMLVMEVRGAEQHGSINKAGNYQGTDIMGFEVHYKDSKRIVGQWGFFAFDDSHKPASMLPTAAACYQCHHDNGAVDTTFVQFYPTLLPIARDKDTLTAAYKKNP